MNPKKRATMGFIQPLRDLKAEVIYFLDPPRVSRLTLNPKGPNKLGNLRM